VRYEAFLRQELPYSLCQELEKRVDEIIDDAEVTLKTQIPHIFRDLQLQLFQNYLTLRNSQSIASSKETDKGLEPLESNMNNERPLETLKSYSMHLNDKGDQLATSIPSQMFGVDTLPGFEADMLPEFGADIPPGFDGKLFDMPMDFEFLLEPICDTPLIDSAPKPTTSPDTSESIADTRDQNVAQSDEEFFFNESVTTIDTRCGNGSSYAVSLEFRPSKSNESINFVEET
jgi:hypothetical protein